MENVLIQSAVQRTQARGQMSEFVTENQELAHESFIFKMINLNIILLLYYYNKYNHPDLFLGCFGSLSFLWDLNNTLALQKWITIDFSGFWLRISVTPANPQELRRQYSWRQRG